MRKLLPLVFAIVALQSCHKDKEKEEELAPVATIPTTMEEAKPSQDFNWSTAEQFSLNISLQKPSDCNNSGPENPTYVLMDSDHEKITSGTAMNGQIASDLCIPGLAGKLVYLYLPETGSIQEIQLGTGTNNKTLTLPCIEPKLKRDRDANTNNEKAGPNCVSGCSREISGTVNNNLSITASETVCITGTFNGGITFEGGTPTLRICGNATIQWINFNGGAKPNVIIADAGKLTSSNINWKDGSLTNYGTYTQNSNFTPDGNFTFLNEGTVTISQMFNTKSGSTITNNGTITAGYANLDGGIFNNNKKFISTGTFTINGGGNLNNSCYVSANNMEVNGPWANSGLINVPNGKFNWNSGNGTMASGAQLNCKDLSLNGGAKFYCTGNASVVKISNSILNNGCTVESGSLDISCATTVSDYSKSKFTVKSGAVLTYKSNLVYIPINTCNIIGHGQPVIVDTDGDGVKDELDEFPTDPTRAYTSAYPYTGEAINGYEDLWPSTGDYDFNDLVLKYNVKFTKNGANKYTKAEITVSINAIGGNVHHGFGIQFLEAGSGAVKFKRLSTNIISSVTGEHTSNEGDNVAILNDDVRKNASGYYTNVGEGPSKTPDIIKYTITFNTAVAQPTTLIPDIFIFRSATRGHEIHLADRPATSKIDKTLYGTLDDKTDQATKWFKTANNLPWGIEIINGTGTFKHPLSLVSISQAYPEFLQWVGSNGTTNTDWYKRPDPTKVFQGN